MLCLQLAVEVIAAVAAFYLLAKTQKDNLGSFFRYSSYFLIIVSFGALVCSLSGAMMWGRWHGEKHCGSRMECREEMEEREPKACCPMHGQHSCVPPAKVDSASVH